MNKGCDHRRIKRNFPFGKNSKPRMFCKDCGKPVSAKEIRENKKQRRRRNE